MEKLGFILPDSREKIKTTLIHTYRFSNFFFKTLDGFNPYLLYILTPIGKHFSCYSFFNLGLVPATLIF